MNRREEKKMRSFKNVGMCLVVFCLALIVIITEAWAAEEYHVTFDQMVKAKAFYNDPSPILEKLSWKKIMPPEDYAKITWDVETMKKVWAEVVGFKAPDVVGKIAPEIKPGKYSYKDKDKYPGLKELMIPEQYEMFKPGGPPHAGNFSEIEVIPTRQYYYALPLGQVTKNNMGQTKLDNQGYLIPESYKGGIPFPRPEGKFKAQQVLYNWDKRYSLPESNYLAQTIKGFNKGLHTDTEVAMVAWQLKLRDRVIMEPLGYFDDVARKRGEFKTTSIYSLAPRDQYGNVVSATIFNPVDQYDQLFLWVNAIRRVRKLSGTDTQDTAAGTDTIYEDQEGFSQKLSPKRFPYKYEIIAEREFLVPAPSIDGSEYFREQGKEVAGLRFERRPIYVLQLTQLDPSFVYSKRIMYFDKETFLFHKIHNFDQKGRLYRAYGFTIWAFHPESGLFALFLGNVRDYVDYHSLLNVLMFHPAPWINRSHVGMEQLIKKGK
jgi:hypothetical protein